ncbi:hypothetical protein IP81_07505 [Novosphingobium sp. AAP83]|nr:hypothetical protein IP81_07505 [Novosphingobium sp. AAP83]
MIYYIIGHWRQGTELHFILGQQPKTAKDAIHPQLKQTVAQHQARYLRWYCQIDLADRFEWFAPFIDRPRMKFACVQRAGEHCRQPLFWRDRLKFAQDGIAPSQMRCCITENFKLSGQFHTERTVIMGKCTIQSLVKPICSVDHFPVI